MEHRPLGPAAPVTNATPCPPGPSRTSGAMATAPTPSAAHQPPHAPRPQARTLSRRSVVTRWHDTPVADATRCPPGPSRTSGAGAIAPARSAAHQSYGARRPQAEPLPWKSNAAKRTRRPGARVVSSGSHQSAPRRDTAVPHVQAQLLQAQLLQASAADDDARLARVDAEHSALCADRRGQTPSVSVSQNLPSSLPLPPLDGALGAKQ